jgi:hypothetical protein
MLICSPSSPSSPPRQKLHASVIAGIIIGVVVVFNILVAVVILVSGLWKKKLIGDPDIPMQTTRAVHGISTHGDVRILQEVVIENGSALPEPARLGQGSHN